MTTTDRDTAPRAPFALGAFAALIALVALLVVPFAHGCHGPDVDHEPLALRDDRRHQRDEVTREQVAAGEVPRREPSVELEPWPSSGELTFGENSLGLGIHALSPGC